ncbi:AAA family ATPase [Caryophanon latum]|uniref:ATPase n=1 Tax=Caryophanon latum TaxID=33977 RepID=A0A1C0Z245_9BACL|nr:ATP-binding protein [Caryophanon latum]OCS93463.1 ATPase [Caryophanon latum]
MLKEIHFSKWKSFDESVLYIDPLTVLIGTNASGKSNALDGLEFLSRISTGKDLQSSLMGDPTLKGIRGGIEWAALSSHDEFTLGALVQGEDEKTDYLYNITVSVRPYVQLKSESLVRIRERSNTPKNPYTVNLISADNTSEDSPSIIAKLYNGRGGTKRECKKSHSILSQLYNLSIQKDVSKGVDIVCKALQGIFILDPIPSLMRNYTAFSKVLNNDASNIAGVLAALPTDEKKRVESILLKYAKQLPERDITEVYTKPVGEFERDAMLYCKEDWGNEEIKMDARGMSDGTLRLLGILTALLTRPSGTQIIIEEVDNGLHPSRSKLLLNMIRNISTERQIDVLVTTHNPALLDELGPEMVPFIVVAHRDQMTGESKLTLLEDIESLPKLMAYGKIGKLSSEGKIEEALAEEAAQDE